MWNQATIHFMAKATQLPPCSDYYIKEPINKLSQKPSKFAETYHKKSEWTWMTADLSGYKNVPNCDDLHSITFDPQHT